MNSWQLSIKQYEQAETGYVREELSGAPFGVYYPYLTQRLLSNESKQLIVS
ncbi:MAG: hypothetical protein HRU15_07550, partial [Planctomycetes bacterium]|nr:hypothetical protein [Planctomycetota bacterium]